MRGLRGQWGDFLVAFTGFYEDLAGNSLFAYDAAEHDAVWLRIGTLDLAGDEPEAAWPLPEHPREMDAWLKRYGFHRTTSAHAEPSVRMYLHRIMGMLHPDNNREIIRDPKVAVRFVRIVQGFASDLEDL